MNKEKVFAWIESLEDMADQSDRYFVERTELYKENQEKDKEIERLNNIIDELETTLEREIKYGKELVIEKPDDKEIKIAKDTLEKVLEHLKELKESK